MEHIYTRLPTLRLFTTNLDNVDMAKEATLAGIRFVFTQDRNSVNSIVM